MTRRVSVCHPIRCRVSRGFRTFVSSIACLFPEQKLDTYSRTVETDKKTVASSLRLLAKVGGIFWAKL